MNGLALKTLLILAGVLVGGAITWAGWTTITLIDVQVSQARLEAKIDALVNPLGPPIAFRVD